MADARPRIPRSKWRKHNILARADGIRGHLPAMRPFSPATAAACMQRFGGVVIKPEWSEGGAHVCRVRRDDGGYRVESAGERRVAAHFREVEALLPEWTRRKPCLVQQYIPLAPHRGRPVDIRTIVQRTPADSFEVTGVFCKVAARRLFVTNVKQGGRVLPLGRYLRGIGGDGGMRGELYRLSERVGDFLGARYCNSVYGIDIGADADRRLWILEVNTEPNLDILRLVDRGMHRRAKALQLHHRPFQARRRRRPGGNSRPAAQATLTAEGGVQ